MLCNKGNLLRNVLAALLVIALANCGGEFNPDLEQASTQNGNTNGGTNDGSDNGGTGSDNDNNGDITTIDPSTGTWEKKDEDGDGVLDENDDFPFDSSRSKFPIIIEKENNNLLSTATEVDSEFPFKLKGELPNGADTDTFRFEISQKQIEERITIGFTLLSTGKDFFPTANLFERNGNRLDTYRPSHIKVSGHIKYAIVYSPTKSGEVFLSITSLFQTSPHEYTVEVDIDTDTDGLGDRREQAIGSNPQSIDTDGDNIIDSVEYYILDIDGSLLLDLDGDGIANLLDSDTDNDGISDQDEGFDDLDGDLNGNFADLDSDGNGINDNVEIGDVQTPIDIDSDGTPDYLDLDDDNDGVQDIHDVMRIVMVQEPSRSDPDKISLTSAITKLKDNHTLHFEGLRGYSTLFGANLTPSKTYIGVLSLDDKNHNLSLLADEDGNIQVRMPMPRVIPFGNKTASLFVYDTENNKRSNLLSVEIIDQQVPIITKTDKKSYKAGELATVYGWNITPKSSIIFGDQSVQLEEFITNFEASFTIPSDNVHQEFTIKNGWGEGNQYKINIINEVSAELDIPNSFQLPNNEIYFLNSLGEYTIFQQGQINQIDLPPIRPEVSLSVKQGDKYVSLLSSTVTNNNIYEVNLHTTLYGWLSASIPNVEFSELNDVDGYGVFYDYIKAKLENNIYYFGFDDTDELIDFQSRIAEFRENSLKKRQK